MASFTTMTAPGPMAATSEAAVSAFMTTRISCSARRATQPAALARMVNQVGNPAMFEGNRFLPLTGMPIWNRARRRTLLAVWLPEPLTVATWMLKSLMTVFMACRRYERRYGGSSGTPRDARVSRARGAVSPGPFLTRGRHRLSSPPMTTTVEHHEPAHFVLSAAQRWLAPVRERLGDDFLSAYITGGAMNPGFDPGKRHVNVLVIAKDLSLSKLDGIAASVPGSHKPPHIDPLFLTMQQVQRSLDVFPIEWLDLKERHWRLEGGDLFDSLEVPQTYLRLQIEQELRGQHPPPAAGLLACAACAAPTRAADESGRAEIPAYTGYVNDVAGVIGEPRRAQLEGFLDQLHRKTGVQFALLTVPTCVPEDPSTYKTRVFNAWGIGDKERKDGLLLLVAMQERALRFETGYGLEGTLPDGWQSRMLRDLAAPRFRGGEPAEGITAAVLSASQRIAAEKGVTLEWDGKELRYNAGGD